VDGVKVYSEPASVSISTLDAPTPPPTSSTVPTETSSTVPTETSTTVPELPEVVAPPSLVGPSNRTASSISVRLFRSPDSGMVCQPDFGYEVRVDDLPWQDIGGIDAACMNASPGVKFSGLAPSTSYVLSA